MSDASAIYTAIQRLPACQIQPTMLYHHERGLCPGWYTVIAVAQSLANRNILIAAKTRDRYNEAIHVTFSCEAETIVEVRG